MIYYDVFIACRLNSTISYQGKKKWMWFNITVDDAN